jgi:hypothetical protein
MQECLMASIEDTLPDRSVGTFVHLALKMIRHAPDLTRYLLRPDNEPQLRFFITKIRQQYTYNVGGHGYDNHLENCASFATLGLQPFLHPMPSRLRRGSWPPHRPQWNVQQVEAPPSKNSNVLDQLRCLVPRATALEFRAMRPDDAKYQQDIDDMLHGDAFDGALLINNGDLGSTRAAVDEFGDFVGYGFDGDGDDDDE